MQDDDAQVGSLLSRREMIALLGAGVGVGLVPSTGAMAQAQCVVRPEQIEGPYFADVPLNRSDIRANPRSRNGAGEARPGVPLELSLQVSKVRPSCAPLAGARVDVWHCDALGFYSNVRDPSFDTSGQFFLRGYQVTDDQGLVRFRTIYPGWYPGRATHIHFKIRAEAPAGRRYEFTSQLYFRDSLTDAIYATGPYAERGKRSTRNREDGFFESGGKRLLLDAVPAADGYAAQFSIAMDI